MDSRTDLNQVESIDQITSQILDANGIAVVLFDLNWNVLFINETASNYFGAIGDNLPASSLWDIIPDGNRNYLKALINQVVLTKEKITLQQKDGSQWKQYLIHPLLGEANQVQTIALCVSDITSKVETEERLKKVLLELITIQEDERHRISQDLHDDVGQKMTVIIFELRSIKEFIAKGQAVSLKEIDSVVRNMETVIKHVRQIFYQLHPPSLNKMELPKVLEAFCSTFEETNHLNVDFSCQDKIPELPEIYDKAIYRFIQEGLNNIVKHARATSAWINLDYTDGDINISIEDNGQGFDSDVMVEGMGLHGIRERILLLSGSMEIESSPGKGTRLFGTIPFKSTSL